MEETEYLSEGENGKRLIESIEQIKENKNEMSITQFLIDEKGIKSNTQKITIFQMVKWVEEWETLTKNQK